MDDVARGVGEGVSDTKMSMMGAHDDGDFGEVEVNATPWEGAGEQSRIGCAFRELTVNQDVA